MEIGLFGLPGIFLRSLALDALDDLFATLPGRTTHITNILPAPCSSALH